jgi:hypothetical protein
MIKPLQMDAEEFRKSINGEVFLNVDLFLAATTFKACLHHALRFDKLFETFLKLDVA